MNDFLVGWLMSTSGVVQQPTRIGDFVNAKCRQSTDGESCSQPGEMMRKHESWEYPIFRQSCIYIPIGSMYGIYANIWGILMVNVTLYRACMDPMGQLMEYLL